MYVVAPMYPSMLLWNLSALAADSRADLLAAYADTPSVADHILLVDTGGASAEQLVATRAAVEAFGARLDAGDRVAVIAVADQARVELPLTPIDEAGRPELEARLAALPLDGGLHFDMGAALNAALELSRASSGSALVVVTLLSDFCHDPPEGSPYAFEGVSGCQQVRGIGELASSFAALSTPRPVVGVAAPIAPVFQEGRRAYFEALTRGDTIQLDLAAPATLAEQYMEEMPRRRLRALVHQEIETYNLSAEVVPTEGDRVRVRLKTGLHHLGLSLVSIGFSRSGLKAERPRVDLAPDGEIDLLVVDAEAPLSIIPRTRTVVFDGYLTGNGSLEPRAELSRLGFRPSKGLIRIPLHIEWVQSYGPPWWAFISGCLLALGGVVAWVRRRRSEF